MHPPGLSPAAIQWDKERSLLLGQLMEESLEPDSFPLAAVYPLEVSSGQCGWGTKDTL